MDRITTAQLTSAFVNHLNALQDAVGVTDTNDYRLERGSKTYGIAFKIVRIVENGGHGNPAVGSMFLGMTTADAYRELLSRTALIWDIKRFNDKKGA
jgi:hypothetical protein